MRFFEEKSALTGCSPRASCYLEKKLKGLESYVVLQLLSWRSLLGDVRFFEKKVHSLSVAPEPLSIWNKELEGLESELFKELKTSPIAAPEHY